MTVKSVKMPGGMEIKLEEGSRLPMILASRGFEDLNGDEILNVEDIPEKYKISTGWDRAARGTNEDFFMKAIEQALMDDGDLRPDQVAAFRDLCIADGQAKEFAQFARLVESAADKEAPFSAWMCNIIIDSDSWAQTIEPAISKSTTVFVRGEDESANFDFTWRVYNALLMLSGGQNYYGAHRFGSKCEEIRGLKFNTEKTPKILRPNIEKLAETYLEGSAILHGLTSENCINTTIKTEDRAFTIAVMPLESRETSPSEALIERCYSD